MNISYSNLKLSRELLDTVLQILKWKYHDFLDWLRLNEKFKANFLDLTEKSFITYLKKNVQNVQKSVSNSSKAILVLLFCDVTLHYVFFCIICILCLKNKVPESYADNCFDLKDDQPIVLVGIVGTLIYSVTSFVALPEKSQGTPFLKIALFYQKCFLFG